MPINPIIEDDIVIKGSMSGIMIVMNLDRDYEKLIKKLVQKVKKEKSFFLGTKLFIKGIDRNLDPDELGMARKMLRDRVKIEIFSPESANSADLNHPETLIEESEPSIRMDIVSHTLRAGEIFSSKNDLVIFGDIHPGANVSSAGSVIVYGKIKGVVEAGQPDQNDSLVTCNGFSPIQLKIGKFTLNADSIEPELQNTPCYLRVEENEIVIYPLKKE